MLSVGPRGGAWGGGGRYFQDHFCGQMYVLEIGQLLTKLIHEEVISEENQQSTESSLTLFTTKFV